MFTTTEPCALVIIVILKTTQKYKTVQQQQLSFLLSSSSCLASQGRKLVHEKLLTWKNLTLLIPWMPGMLNWKWLHKQTLFSSFQEFLWKYLNLCWIRVAALYIAGVILGSLGATCVEPRKYLLGASAGVYALILSHLG